MKKAMLVLIALLCVIPLFAAKNELKVKMAPIAVQIMTSSAEPDYNVVSSYGLGAEIFYRRIFKEIVFVECGILGGMYQLPNRPNLENLMAFAGVGFSVRLSDVTTVSIHGDVGADTRFYDGSVGENISAVAGLEVAIAQSEKAKATIGVDATFGYPKCEDTKYVTYRIIPTVGMTVCY